MAVNWKITARAPKLAVEAALAVHEGIDEWDADFIVGAAEVPDHPADWVLEAWLPRRPTRMDQLKLEKLFTGRGPPLEIARLPNTDWLVQSQQQVAPILAGPFHIHTPDHAPSAQTGIINFEIPAAQAFGTGHHETTAGCLEMLSAMRRSGVRARNIADIGTGTGLLAFAAMALWPRSFATASDIDPVCAEAVFDNAARNRVPIGIGQGQLAMTVADGMDDELLAARAPYDVLIANILAGPLIDLAPDFADAAAPRGHIVLAGLLATQERAVRAAYLRAGFRYAARLQRGDWSILWLRRRFSAE